MFSHCVSVLVPNILTNSHSSFSWSFSPEPSVIYLWRLLFRLSAHFKQPSSLQVCTTIRCRVLISPPHSRRWQHDTRLAPAVSRVTSIAEGAFSSLELWRDTPRLHSLLQIRQDVWYNGLFGDEDDRLHHQQEDPPKSPEPIGGAQAGEVLTDLLPVLISEKGPAEEEEET